MTSPAPNTANNEGELDKVCDICCQTSIKGVSFLYGPWILKKGIKAHCFCLLLSTNIPPNGTTKSGKSEFLLCDVQKEIVAAKKRLCCYCCKKGASISCKVCKKYFHLRCGRVIGAIHQFTGDFSSFCTECYPLNDLQKQAKAIWQDIDMICVICNKQLGRIYDPFQYIHAACCENGFVHRNCIQKLAMSVGNYLKCIWCKSDEFREGVRLQGIYVPNRKDSSTAKKSISLNEFEETIEVLSESDEAGASNRSTFNEFQETIEVVSESDEAGASNRSTAAINLNTPDYQIFEVYETKTCKLRLDMNSDRFRGKTINEILNTSELVTKSDFAERSEDLGLLKLKNVI